MTDPKFPPAIIAAAQFAHRTTGIPASVSLAQWALESGWGQHMPPGTNNCFGVKATGSELGVEVETHEVVNGDVVTIRARFRTYPSMAAAFEEHAELLARPLYAEAQKLLPDAVAFCHAIAPPNRPAYATDPSYGAKLEALIRQHDLTQFDVLPGAVTPPPLPEPHAKTTSEPPAPTAFERLLNLFRSWRAK